MKSFEKPSEVIYLDLYEALLLPDYVSQSSYFQSQSRKDYLTIKSRASSSEGFQFCTKTLPKLGKAFDLGLVEGEFHCPSQFKTKKGKRIPALMQGFFALVFNCDSGELLARPSIDAIKHIRMICYWYYKLELPFSDNQVNSVLQNFQDTEDDISRPEVTESINNSIDVRIASELTGGTMYHGEAVNIFGNFDPKDIKPKHGPGAVATGEKGEEKWKFSRLYQPLNAEYPYSQYYMWEGMYDSIDPLRPLSDLQQLPHGGTAKVCLVPKDSRGPRLISSEPLEYMWFQQGLGAGIVSHLESGYRTKGQINFTSQSINRFLALTGSTPKGCLSTPGMIELKAIRNANMPIPYNRNGRWATLDLKDASDRVALDLVKRIFKHCPVLLRSLLALRTTATLLPNGNLVSLSKFAPMGSALCFPIEAYCFWILIVAAISRNSTQPLYRIMKSVFVYGDDIIVPEEWSQTAINVLESVSLKVNVSKCCLTGRFKESCGMDAFDGNDVTPLKCRTVWTGKATDHEALVSYVAYANKLRERGYTEAFHFLFQKIERLYGSIPWGVPTSGYICWWASSIELAVSINRVSFKSVYDPRYHAFVFRFRTVSTKKLQSGLDSVLRLLRNFTSGPGDDPSVFSLPRRSIILRGRIVAS